MIRDRDWTSHPLGAPASWPAELKAALSLILNSPESMILAWGSELSFFFNDTYARLLGPRVAWAMGSRFDEVWADGWEQAKPIIAEAQAGRSIRYVDLPWKLATDRGAADTWWSFSYSRVLDAEGKVAGLFIFTNETTDFVLSRAAENRNRQILDSATDYGIVATDLIGRVTRWNDGAQRIFGWSQGEMLGQPLARIFTPEDQARNAPQLEMKLAVDRGQANDERWHQRKDGELFWAAGETTPLRDEAGGIAGFVKVLRDQTDQLMAERSLREAESSLRRAQEAGGVGTFWVSLDDNLLHPTPEFCRIYGLPERGTYDTSAFERLIIAEDQALVSDRASRAEGIVKSDVTYRIRRADTGALRWISRRAEIERDVHGRPVRFVGASRDITEQQLIELRQAARLALSDAFRYLRTPQDIAFAACEAVGSSLGIDCVRYDIVDPQHGLRPERGWTAQRMAPGVGSARIMDFGYPLADFDHGETVVVADVRRDVRTATDAGALAPEAVRAFCQVPISEQGRLVALFSAGSIEPHDWTDGELNFIRDVAERTRLAAERARADAEVRRQTAELAALNASLEHQVKERTADRNALWQLSRDLMLRSTFEGTITAVNPAWTELLGWSETDLVGAKLFDLIHPDDLAATVEGARTLSEGQGHKRFDNRYRHRDGSYRWISWSTRPGEGLINAVGRDITAEKLQADLLLKTEEQLRQSQKMEAVGQLTGGIAHDFNNLLTGITGSLDLLNTRIAQGRLSDVERYTTAAQGAAKRAAALTHRLLAFSRRQTLDPKPTDVNRLVGGLEDLIRRTVGPAIHIETVAAAGLWPTLIDPGQLENALLNLCINSRDAMPDGGRITIETANRRLDDSAATTHGIAAGAYVSLCVSDTGAGMSADVVARAFEPFFTTKPLGTGTGLGLSMIYGFVRQSGGHVRIYSELDEGTIVCLYLPRSAEVVDAAATSLGPGATPRAEAGETVLVVDDEPSVRMLVMETLEDLGYAAIEAADGPSGLRVLESDARIDLLVTDVGLPGGMNGRQMVDAARAARPGLKVLFITGYAENAVVGNGHLEPGMHIMTKPFAMEALASRIRNLIAADV